MDTDEEIQSIHCLFISSFSKYLVGQCHIIVYIICPSVTISALPLWLCILDKLFKSSMPLCPYPEHKDNDKIVLNSRVVIKFKQGNACKLFSMVSGT